IVQTISAGTVRTVRTAGLQLGLYHFVSSLMAVDPTRPRDSLGPALPFRAAPTQGTAPRGVLGRMPLCPFTGSRQSPVHAGRRAWKRAVLGRLAGRPIG